MANQQWKPAFFLVKSFSQHEQKLLSAAQVLGVSMDPVKFQGLKVDVDFDEASQNFGTDKENVARSRGRTLVATAKF
jgi:hypothetical protein